MTGSMDKKSILYIADDFWACGWYRCHVPGMALKRLGHHVVLNHVPLREEVDEADIVVFQRQHSEAALKAMEYAKAAAKLTVYELDDDLWGLDRTNPGYEAWRRPDTIGLAEVRLRLADVVTTTTGGLARKLRAFNRNVCVLPNMLPSEHWQVRRERPPGYDRVRIGWAGSTNRGLDVGILKDVVPQVLDRYSNVEFLITGDSNMIFAPHDRIRRLEACRIEQYPHLLAEFDIGLAPLVDSRFNRGKSDLKFVEYGILAIPAVASPVEPYTSSIVNGENGLIARNDKDWLKYLRRLIEQPDLRESIGARAKAFAEARTIERNVGLWERAYGIAAARKAAS